MLPLTMLEIGQSGYISKITGKDNIRSHLAELGFTVGTPITIVSKISGNVVLSLKDSRIALDSSMANRILV